MTINTLDYFTYLVRQEDSIPLFEAALSFGQDIDLGLDLNALQIELDQLGLKIKKRLPADVSPIQKLRLLNHFFYQELGFCANVNDYYHPDNSYLHRVMHTRRGIPISLAVIYIELAHQIDLQIRGIAFPGHFLMKLSVQSGDIILDPVDGISLSKEELLARLEPYVESLSHHIEPPLALYLQPASPHAILVRMLRNLKDIYFDQHLWNRLLAIQERLVILLPRDASERRDRGLAYAHLNCPAAALADLEHYLSEQPNARDALSMQQKLPQLRDAARRLN